MGQSYSHRAIWCAATITCATLAPSCAPHPAPTVEALPAGSVRILGSLIAAASERGIAGPVYVALRGRGKRLAETWSSLEGTQAAASDLLSRPRNGEPACDAIELAFTHSYRVLETARAREALAECHRGVRGLELDLGDRVVRWSPTEMLARNLSFERAMQLTGGSPRIVRTFEAEQYLLQLEPEPELRSMFRGNTVESMAAVDSARVGEAAELMATWLARHVRPDGRLTYKYWPSRGEESAENNVLRQVLGSLALVRASRADLAVVTRDIVRANLEFNLQRFYREEPLEDGNHVGYLEHEGEVKLGAAALLALALREAGTAGEYETQERNLRNFVLSSWRLDGSFRTFYKPRGRTGCENFYPGEALLYLATVATEESDSLLLELCGRSLRHYRAWHLENRNPAFVPWHTQACQVLWRQTRDPFLASWVFEMNDWLLEIQQWGDAPYDDLRGRFYDPSRPFGPPHASSTAVYLEGLSDAYEIARELGDGAREARYGLAIRRGIRSLLQLQFRDAVDLYYVARPDLVRGGLRTTEYDNSIRVDNVQHALMAFLEIRRLGPRLFDPHHAGFAGPPALEFELAD